MKFRGADDVFCSHGLCGLSGLLGVIRRERGFDCTTCAYGSVVFLGGVWHHME